MIDAVAAAPGGSRPSYSLGITERDNDFYRFWDEISRDRDAFVAWMNEHVLSGDGAPMTRDRRSDRRRGPDGGRGAPAARARSVFIGVGRPSTAAILARAVHNPELVLVYESGTIGAKPVHVPLSIGDGELAETADFVVCVPEMFNYWIGPGGSTSRSSAPRRSTATRT